MSYDLDLLALAASCFALYFIIRAKKTYFLDSGFFIGIAALGFIAYVVEATYSDIHGDYVSIPIDMALIFVMAVSIGFASYLLNGSDLKVQENISQVRRFLSRPPIAFVVYLSVVFGWTISGLLLQPWVLNRTGPGSMDYYYTYPSWYVGISVLLLGSFICLPVASFFRLSRTVTDGTASISMKIISGCWAMFGLSVFFQVVGGAFLLPATQSLGFVVDSFLFVLIAFALREPTILARIVTSGEAVSQAVSSLTADSIVLYNTESDRRKLIETFVRDGVSKGILVVCRVARSEAPFYKAVLKGFSLGDSADKTVMIQPLESATAFSHQVPVPSNGFQSKELVDLDELDEDRSKEIISQIIKQDDMSPSNRPSRIWALNVDGSQPGIVDTLTSNYPNLKIIDFARQQDVFSSFLGLKHKDILGQRMLLEFEPASSYEDIVQEFVREFQTNVESVAIFTNSGSPLYREFIDQSSVRLFSFSTRTSTPSRITSEQVLLPERDTSLLLDAVDKLLQANKGRQIGIVFEVFTYLILSLGFEKAYGVVSSIVEMAESELATVLVLVNSEALESRVLSGLRGLFQSQMVYDTTGLRAIRVSRGGLGRTGDRDPTEINETYRRLEV